MKTWKNPQTGRLVPIDEIREYVRLKFKYENDELVRIRNGRKEHNKHTKGYRVVTLCGCKVLLHHAVWLFHNEYLPEEVDHGDRNRDNNRIGNLRASTRSQNKRNKTKSVGKSSKYRGVSWATRRSKWVAEIRIDDNKRKYLGAHDSETAAALAYNAAAIIYHGEFAHLNKIEEGI